MHFRRLLILGTVVLAGCKTDVDKRTDQIIADMSRKMFDREPADSPNAQKPPNANSTQPGDPALARQQSSNKDIRAVSYLEGIAPDGVKDKDEPFKFTIPDGVPGKEVPEIKAKNKEEMLKVVKEVYTPLPPLAQEPKPLPRADGKAYTLADFQDIAVLNSPTLKQAASDVLAAKGAVVQAATYANPSLYYSFQASNDGETASVQGFMWDQKISTAGKMKLAVAAAQKNYEMTELALKRARSDLSTAVRQAYFGLIVARETVRVNLAVAKLTDEIYLAQVNMLLKGGQAAGYEPSTLRAQAYTARLALETSIVNLQFAWKQIVVTIGLRQLPYSDVAGRVDAYIPYFDYDKVMNYVTLHHTDILIAHHGIEQARYNLKLAQTTPFSDIDFQFYVGKESSLQPFQWQAVGQVGITLPLWDQNRGNIMSADAALVRATEQPHTAEINLSNNLQNAFNNYWNNLKSLDLYRRNILPDQVRYYRGVLERRHIDPNASFGDLVQAQQTLAGNVTTYLTILSSLWTSAVQVADFLQTDDMFQLANPTAVPSLPDLGKLPPLPCCHPQAASGATGPNQPACTAPATNIVSGRDVPPILPQSPTAPLFNAAPIAAPQTKP